MEDGQKSTDRDYLMIILSGSGGDEPPVFIKSLWENVTNQPERPIRCLEETFSTFYSRAESTFNLCQITRVISRTLALNGSHIQIRNCLGIVGLQQLLNRCILMYIATVVDVY